MNKLWQNYVTSGLNESGISDSALTRIIFFNFFSLVGIASTIVYSIAHLASGDISMGMFQFSGGLFLAINLMYLRKSYNYEIASHALLLGMIALLDFLLFTGGFRGTGIFWIYTFPALAFFLKGKLHGLYYMLLLAFVALASYFLNTINIVPHFYYGFSDIRQMLSSLTAVSLLVYYYEKVKGEKEEIIQQNEKEIVIKNIFDQQFEDAGEIQRNYIPQDTYHSKFIDLAGYYKPAMVIGGDYFDIIPLDANRTGVIISDVSSKGIPAALVMVKFRTMIKMIPDIKTFKPSQLFTYLNDNLAKEFAGSLFISSIYIIINHKTGTIELTNAGHPPMAIFSAKENKIITIEASAMPMGISENLKFKNHEIKVNKNDIILLHTDGISEIANANKQRYGYERIYSQLESSAKLSAKSISDNIIDDVMHFSNAQHHIDDIALVVIKIR
jgi:serine phosphatase RsbU (regulator of sigma subunit)